MVEEKDISDLKKNLDRKNISQLSTVKFGKSPYIIGAPHHTPGGVKYMPCNKHKDGDENVGFLALALAKQLKGQCVIASNYWCDSNKLDSDKYYTDYLSFIEKEKPKFLIEIHGQGGKRKKIQGHSRKTNYGNRIDISCGTKKQTDKSEELAGHVFEEIDKLQHSDDSLWNKLNICGEFSNMYFQATKVYSLTCVRKWGGIPYHIEIPPKLRRLGKDKNYIVPEEGKELMIIIAKSLKKMEGTK